MPKVSVVVPVFNKERYLHRSINSILNQTLIDLEVILINDGSTDNSLEICNEFAAIDDRVRVINQINGGVSNARNTGIAVSKGEYIGFVDPDDWIEEDMYESMYQLCIEKRAEVCITNYIIDYPTHTQEIILKKSGVFSNKEEIFNDLVLDMIAPQNVAHSGVMGSVWRLLIKNEVILKNQIQFDETMKVMEDLVFSIEIMLKVNTVVIEKKCQYHYYQNEDSVMNKFEENLHKIETKASNSIQTILEKENLEERAYERISNRYVNSALTIIFNETNSNNKKNFQTKLDFISKICLDSNLQKSIKQVNFQGVSIRKRTTIWAIKRNRPIILYFYFMIVRKINKLKFQV